MDERLYAFLKYTAIALGLLWIGWTAYDGLFAQREPGDNAYLAGNRAFKDGAYDRALAAYEDALAADAGHIHALRGKARALMQLGRDEAALAAYDRAIERAPAFGPAYANRGILNDRMGRHRRALADYERALALTPELAEGPGWLTRFLRNQPEKPPTIAERAAYLRAELAKPEDERLLRLEQADSAQKPYEM